MRVTRSKKRIHPATYSLNSTKLSSATNRIAVIIPAYNVGPYVGQAIDSVLEQKIDVPCRIYIAEDCSTDQTREVCMDYAVRYPDRIELTCNSVNLGLPRSFSQVHNRVNEEYFCVLDGDDYYTNPDKLAIQYETLEQCPDVAVCAHNTVCVSDDGGVRVSQNGESIHTVDRRIPERTFCAGDLARGSVYFASSSLLYRNFFRHRVPSCFYEDRGRDEVIRTILHAEFGRIAYAPHVMSAWRIRSGSLWNGMSYQEQRLRQLNDYAAWNEITEYRYDEELAARSLDLIKSDIGRGRALLAVPAHPVFHSKMLWRAGRNVAGHWWRRLRGRAASQARDPTR